MEINLVGGDADGSLEMERVENENASDVFVQTKLANYESMEIRHVKVERSAIEDASTTTNTNADVMLQKACSSWQFMEHNNYVTAGQQFPIINTSTAMTDIQPVLYVTTPGL